MIQRAITVALLLSIALVTEAPGADAPPLANEYCPVMLDKKAVATHSVVHEGETVFFCCKRCVTRFNGNPSKYVAELPQFAETKVEVPSADEATPEASSSRVTRFLGSFHPVVIHFPIALGIVAALFESLFLIRRSSISREASRLCAMLAGVAALVAAPLGWLAAEGFAATAELDRHRWSGVAAAVLLIGAALLGRRAENGSRASRAYSAVILLAAVVVGVTGWLASVAFRGADFHAF